MQKKHRAAEVLLNTRLVSDTLWIKRKPGIICSNDAKSCFNRIAHAIFAICLCRLHTHENPVKSIIDTLSSYDIKTFADKENIGIWHDNNNQIKKVAAIGIRISKWIAYHGFSINISNDLKKYESIIPCGIQNKGVTNLKTIKDQNYNELDDKLIENFISNLEN